jgi:hypothetical protein
MWTCTRCGRVFGRTGQQHSCKNVPLEVHFVGKELARKLLDCLVERIRDRVGECKIVSIPCCVHLYGTYDFLAALPKKDSLEVRIALDRKLDNPRLKVCVPMSTKVFKNCFEIRKKEDIDDEFLGWLGEAYHLKG